MAIPYVGPECPYCETALELSEVKSGMVQCRYCSGLYEATAFTPAERRERATEVLVATPDGVANACANHERNAAVTACQRCGLFICELCDMNLGEGSLCPSCFDRGRAERTLAAADMRYRDHASIARIAVLCGFLFTMMFLGLPFGAVGVYYSIKGIRQRRAEGASVIGMVVTMILAILEILGSIVMIGAIILALAK